MTVGVGRAVAANDGDREYVWDAVDRSGRPLKGRIVAASPADALRAVQKQGVTPIRLDVVAASRSLPSARKGQRRASAAETIGFLRELAVLVRAGVPLAQSFDALAEAHGADHFAAPVHAMRTALGAGGSFEHALSSAELNLPSYVLQLVAAGERTGRLGAALTDAVTQLAYDEQVRQEIRNALTYPALLVGAGFVAVGIMFFAVVPRFAHLLRGGRAEVPALSRWVIESGIFVNEHVLALGLALVLLLGLCALAATNPLARESVLSRVVRLPVVGRWFMEVEIGRWAKTLSALLGNRVQLLDALEHASRVPRLPQTREALVTAAQELRAGRSLHDVLAQTRLFSPMQLNMVRAGERSGELAGMIGSVAEAQIDTCRNRMRRFLVLLEPVAILTLAVVIGTIMIAIMLAITSLNTMRL